MVSKACLIVVLVAVLALAASAARFRTPLEKYVNNEDDTFEWEVMSSVTTASYTAYVSHHDVRSRGFDKTRFFSFMYD